jgi:hypothetical protein
MEHQIFLDHLLCTGAHKYQAYRGCGSKIHAFLIPALYASEKFGKGLLASEEGLSFIELFS